MSQRTIKLGIPDDEGQLSLQFARGGRRRGAGRKGIGETRKVSLTLMDGHWRQLEDMAAANQQSRSEALRSIVEAYFAVKSADREI